MKKFKNFEVRLKDGKVVKIRQAKIIDAEKLLNTIKDTDKFVRDKNT